MIKRYIKLIIGIFTILFVFCVFIFSQKSVHLESKNLRHWRSVSDDQRASIVQVMIASDENLDLIVQCVNKISTLPESSGMAIRDAVELCFLGIKLQNNN